MSTQFLGKQVIDLTLQLEAGKQSWNIHPAITLLPYHQSSLDRWRNGHLCPGFDTKLMICTDHIGTHMDAPSHFHPDGKSIAETPLDKMMGEALFLDVSKDKEENKPISVMHLEKALKRCNMQIRENDILILKCWKNKWGEGENFDSADALAGETAQWMLDKKIKLLGTDIPTVDDLSNPGKDVHVMLLKNQIPIIENLVSLEKLQEGNFYFMGLPLKIKGATGSPIRALAFI